MSVCEELCVELTDLCNQACVHCSTNATQNAACAKRLPFDTVSGLLRWFAGQGGSLVELSGGEPLLYPDLLPTLGLARSLDLETRLYTTGAPKMKHIPALEQLADAGLSSAVFSLQGASRATHERITRVPGSFERTISNVRDYVRAGLWVGLHFVPVKLNYRDVRAMAELASDLGVKELAFLRFVPQGRGLVNRAELELSHPEFQRLLHELSDLVVSETRLAIRAGCPLSFCVAGFESKQCKAGATTALVDSVGRMHACPAFKNLPGMLTPGFGLNWEAAWSDCQRNVALRMASEGLSGICTACEDLLQCQGRCAAQRYLAHGSIVIGPDPMCPLAGVVSRSAAVR